MSACCPPTNQQSSSALLVSGQQEQHAPSGNNHIFPVVSLESAPGLSCPLTNRHLRTKMLFWRNSHTQFVPASFVVPPTAVYAFGSGRWASQPLGMRKGQTNRTDTDLTNQINMC